MCTQDVQLFTRERQFSKTSKYAHKRCNSQHGIGEAARLPNVHTRGPNLNTRKEFGKTSECAHKRSNSQHGIGESARLQNVHTRCPTLNTGKAVWIDFRMCTQEVQLSKRDRLVGNTSEYAYKMSNSPHGVGSFARLLNVHTRGPTLNTA
ncbi:hypothetical protein PoB_003929600 [Plakobranchus ocellatus]|uniref:Uncharacterized protein n=1 Tax=Plakobranchus ocellatus TaxID=259542 RepID=A0AAV4ANQ2_9GAST|nr:hypothetical protein PoB_003929600 [Plakobranchus ocellatus]